MIIVILTLVILKKVHFFDISGVCHKKTKISVKTAFPLGDIDEKINDFISTLPLFSSCDDILKYSMRI